MCRVTSPDFTIYRKPRVFDEGFSDVPLVTKLAFHGVDDVGRTRHPITLDKTAPDLSRQMQLNQLILLVVSNRT
jgi:hypothetical protein